MAKLPPVSRQPSDHSAMSLDHGVRAGIWLSFGVLVVLSAMRNVNWDEFYFLSHVYAFADGRLDRPLQTFFVRGFGWLTDLPGQEPFQIIIARMVMILFVGVTALSIHRIAKHLTDSGSANIAVLAFLASGFVFPHGASFRADPMAAALLCASIAIIVTSQMRLQHIIAVTVFSALAVLITVKSALFAPAYLAALLWRSQERDVLVKAVIACVMAVALAGVLYVWHASGITPASGNETSTNLQDAASTGLLRAGWLPRAPYVVTWMALTIGPLILFVVGLAGASRTKQRALLILFAAPLLSVMIYRNAWPYFFPFAAPLMMVGVAMGAHHLQTKPWRRWLVIVIFVTGGMQAILAATEGMTTQRETIAEVHRIFPQPVTYIDDSNMIASFPSVGPFLSSWGMQNYRAKGEPTFARLIEKHQPPLLIANKATLIQTMQHGSNRRLLVKDAQLLRETYIQYTGAIWLAGRELTLSQETTNLRMPVAGHYLLSATAPIAINGAQVVNGQSVVLADEVTIVGETGTELRLIWDTGVPLRQDQIRTDDLYADFWVLPL